MHCESSLFIFVSINIIAILFTLGLCIYFYPSFCPIIWDKS